MPAFRLQAGAEVDVLSADELRDELRVQTEQLRAALDDAPTVEILSTTLVAVGAGVFAGPGNVTAFTDPGVPIYTVPSGMRAVFVRLAIRQFGAATNLTNLEFYRTNVNPGSYVQALTIPAATAGGTYAANGRHQAPHLVDGEVLVVSGTTAGAAGTQLAVTGQVFLYPLKGAQS